VGDDLVTDIGGGHEVGAAVVLARSGKGDRLQPGAEAEPYVHHLQPPSTACPAPNLRD
jgi:ribonucleotide monophosphatase NagD (HAD superfamily)